MAKFHGATSELLHNQPAEAATPAQPEMVSIPAEQLRQLQARLDALEQTSRAHAETLTNSRVKILDREYEEWKKEVSRPASERTQDMANARYTGPEKYRVSLDSTTEEGKPGPRVDEHFALVIAAHSDLEAQARYLEIMGIRKHDYRLRIEPAAAAVA